MMRVKTLLLGACLALLCAPAMAQSPEPTLNVAPWLEAAKNQLMNTINQGGNALFTILASMVGLGVVMRMLASVTNFR